MPVSVWKAVSMPLEAYHKLVQLIRRPLAMFSFNPIGVLSGQDAPILI